VQGFLVARWGAEVRSDLPALVLSQVPEGEGVKCRDILYILSPDILYTCCHPVKRRQALLESNLTEE
jgi:hypothetical protein